MAANSRSGNAVLAKALADAGWRPEDLARRLNAAAEAHHYAVKLNPKTPFKWRDQGVQPRPPWPELIALVLSEATSAAFLPEDFGWRSHAGVAPACGLAQWPWTVEGAQHAMRDLTHAPLQRRRFLMLAGAAATAAPLKWLVTPEVERVIGRGDGQISDTVITEIDQTTASARRMNDQLGSTVELLDLVHAQFAFVSRLLDRYSYTDSVGRRLHASAGELLRLAGSRLTGGTMAVLSTTGPPPYVPRTLPATVRSAPTSSDSCRARLRTCPVAGSRPSRSPKLRSLDTRAPALASPPSSRSAWPRRTRSPGPPAA